MKGVPELIRSLLRDKGTKVSEKIDTDNHECRGLKDIADFQSSPNSGRIKSFIGTVHGNNGRTQPLTVLCTLSQEVFTTDRRNGLTRAKLNGIIDFQGSSSKGDDIVSKDTISHHSSDGSYHSQVSHNPPSLQGSDCSIWEDNSGCPNSYDGRDYAALSSPSQLLEQSNPWHEQCREIERHGVEMVRCGQKLERYGWHVRKLLDGYFPSMADRLGLTEQQFIEYDAKIKVNVEIMQREVERYRRKLVKYDEIHSIDHINQILESIDIQVSEKYKTSFNQYRDTLISLQEDLHAFSNQLANNAHHIKCLVIAFSQIKEKHKRTRNMVDDPEWIRDIVDEPELARDIASNPDLLRNVLKDISLTEYIINDFLPHLDGYQRCHPERVHLQLDNFELAKEISIHRELAEKILYNRFISQYIVDHPDDFQGINSVVTIKENATALFSKMLEAEKKQSQLHKTTVPALLADLKGSFEEN